MEWGPQGLLWKDGQEQAGSRTRGQILGVPGSYRALAVSDGDEATSLQPTGRKVCWWHMADGAVLGVHDNMLIEYDAETLSPLGVVVPSSAVGQASVVERQGMPLLHQSLLLARSALTWLVVVLDFLSVTVLCD